MDSFSHSLRAVRMAASVTPPRAPRQVKGGPFSSEVLSLLPAGCLRSERSAGRQRQSGEGHRLRHTLPSPFAPVGPPKGPASARPPGPATGRAFFAETFHWKVSDRSSPLGGRFSPARSGAGLSRSWVAGGSGGSVLHGRGEAVPRLFPPEWGGSKFTNGFLPSGAAGSDAAATGRKCPRSPHAASAASSRSCAFIHIASARSRPSMTSAYFFCQVSTSPPRPFS